MIRPGENLKISSTQIAAIRGLSDFDLVMLLSEIADHGWPTASVTLEMIVKANRVENVRNGGAA